MNTYFYIHHLLINTSLLSYCSTDPPCGCYCFAVCKEIPLGHAVKSTMVDSIIFPYNKAHPFTKLHVGAHIIF